ncbi:MAG: MiaB/RimO family radical SAM methylthiotransferase [Acidobacteriota bacterium]
MRFYIQTLGCKINQYESQALRECWEERGWREADAPAQAEVVLVHTCAVTSGAVADSRRAVSRLARAAPDARVLVTGCASQVEPEVFAAMPGVNAVVPQAVKPGLGAWSPACVPDEGVATPSRRRSSWPDFSISRFSRARPILKIQDGCSHCCTYCIVPRARGPARSRPFADILTEARRLLDSGHRELILSGINLGQFELEDGGDFWAMLARLEAELSPQWAGTARLRLSSLDPGMLGRHALAVLADSHMTCPHLHLSMQSGDPGVLAAMGRGHYAPAAVLDFLEELRGFWPHAAVGADILTGFPGESEDSFQATREFCRAARLGYAHVFAFSRRPGTLAARAAGQIDRDEKRRRAALLRGDVEILERAYLKEIAGLPRLVMAVEGGQIMSGSSEYYVECRLERPSPVAWGGLLPVRPLGLSDGALLVEPA